ncbi:MAG: hypothetical protein RQ847_11355 [Wenzhouxiangellaceae bacterium]|nr:hypothetical protein [Wenzhouxiangellaceae bacterium]
MKATVETGMNAAEAIPVMPRRKPAAVVCRGKRCRRWRFFAQAFVSCVAARPGGLSRYFVFHLRLSAFICGFIFSWPGGVAQ